MNEGFGYLSVLKCNTTALPEIGDFLFFNETFAEEKKRWHGQ